MNTSVPSGFVEVQTPRFIPVKVDDHMCYPFFKCIHRTLSSQEELKKHGEKRILVMTHVYIWGLPLKVYGSHVFNMALLETNVEEDFCTSNKSDKVVSWA